MATLIGGIGFFMMLIGAGGADSEGMAAFIASLAICVAGAGLVLLASRMGGRRRRSYR